MGVSIREEVDELCSSDPDCMPDAGCSQVGLVVEVESPWHHIVFPSFPANSMPVVVQEEGVSWGVGEAESQQFVEEVGV